MHKRSYSKIVKYNARIFYTVVISCVVLFIGPLGLSSQAQLNPVGNGLQGYISSATGAPPAGYDMGYGFYSALWPLTDQPIKTFQIGLPATWIIPNNRDNTNTALCPPGTFARQWIEREPTFDGVFQTVEGGLGYWGGNRFHYGPPKYMMNSVPSCYDYEVSTPGWGFFKESPLADKDLAIAQLSNRLLLPPDGITFEGNPIGEFLGFTYLALPLTEKKISPKKVGNNSWTLFLNSVNFKGPVAFIVPDTWVKVAENYPFIAERGLDARGTSPFLAAGTMEINTVPFFKGTGDNGTVYTKIPELQFPLSEGNRSVLARDVSYYSKSALYDDIENWKNGGAVAHTAFDQSGIYAAQLRTSPVNYRQEDIPIVGFNEKAKTKVFDDGSFGLEWSDPDGSQLQKFPQYFINENGSRIAITASEVPAETNLINTFFDRPSANPSAYEPSLTGAWETPGPASGPFTTTLNDGSLVTYYWYRFIDQPVFQQYNWTPTEKNKLQSLVENIHRHWKISDDYMKPISKGALVSIDDNVIVTPPSGLEIGYVPIVTRQSTQSDLDCSQLNVTLGSSLVALEDGRNEVTLMGSTVEDMVVTWDDGAVGPKVQKEGRTYSALGTLSNCTFYHYSPPYALAPSGIDQSSFFANWEMVTGAKGYLIEVARDAQFNQLLPDWRDRTIDNIDRIEIPVLSNISTYYYRLTTIGFEGERSTVSNTVKVDLNSDACHLDVVASVRDVSNFSRNDGSIDIEPKGGNSPYRYAWSNGGDQSAISNLAIGKYNVTVSDADNCKIENEFDIGLPIGSGSLGNRVWHDLNRNGIDDFGEPGIAGVKVALWKDSNNDQVPDQWQGFVTTDADGYYAHTNLTPGTYRLFVWEIDNFTPTGPLHRMVNTNGQYDPNNDIDGDDNGQPGSTISVLNDVNIVSKNIILSAGDEPLNDGDRTDPNFNYDPSGNMTIDFGFYADNNDCPVINVAFAGTKSLCQGDTDGFLTVNPASGFGPYTYQWNDGSTNTTIDNLDVGDYQVTVTDANGCQGNTAITIMAKSISACSTTDVKEVILENRLQIFPNPSGGIFNIRNNHTEDLKIKVFNLNGRLVFEKDINRGESSIELQEEAEGIYLIQIREHKSAEVAYLKLIKVD